ncbi:hypothetical protein ElyMa_001599600 [Elysia marginata]|uniref:Uncharacterized protein n=1 Tax=Elysia marginata TaxID=1093978 RepID=A0AAV4JL67_9GAST|nr:hypothetical protein ElyMa_001599600 [Elysia marginata]
MHNRLRTKHAKAAYYMHIQENSGNLLYASDRNEVGTADYLVLHCSKTNLEGHYRTIQAAGVNSVAWVDNSKLELACKVNQVKPKWTEVDCLLQGPDDFSGELDLVPQHTEFTQRSDRVHTEITDHRAPWLSDDHKKDGGCCEDSDVVGQSCDTSCLPICFPLSW